MSQPLPTDPGGLPSRPHPVVHDVRLRAPGLSANPDALALLKALRRRWRLAIGLGLLLAIVAGPTVWLIVPRAKYTAMATLQIATKPKRIMFEPQESLADYRTYQKTQQEIVKNRKILADALSRLNSLATIKEQIDAEEWLQEKLRVDFPGGSEILQVSLSGDRAEDLAKIVNEVIKSYMTLIVEQEREERLNRLDQLKKLWEKYQDELNLKRKSLRQVADSVGANDQIAVSLAQQFKVENLGLIQRELYQVQTEILRLQSEIAIRGTAPTQATRQATSLAKTSRGPTLDEVVESDPDVIDAREQVALLWQKYREIDRITVKKNDAALVKMRARYEQATKHLADARTGVRMNLAQTPGARPTSAAPASDPSAMDLASLKRRLDVLKSYQTTLTQESGRLEQAMQRTNRGSLDLETEREQIAIATDVARKVGAEVEAVQVEIGAPERIQLLAQAKPPTRRDELRKIKLSGVAALGAFACGLLGVSFWEFRAHRVDHPSEVAAGLGLRIVGSLPAPPSRARRQSVTASGQADRRWRSLLVESVDATRTMLLHASRIESVRVVLVTSALKGEGKTSLSCHLATSLARSGLRTLLIDCDLRSPSVHRLFEVPSTPGVCDLLRSESDLDEVIVATAANGLDLIPAGHNDADALQALAQGGLSPIFDLLRARYDFIIVDSAPVLPVVDSLLISQHVDGVLFTVLRDVSRLPCVHDACARLTTLGAKMLGVVVNGVTTHGYTEYYSSH
ncbi:MAG: polysaccharide biosynthesis tyrosine autokinase [Isosphaeraceae bacterium]